MPALEAFGTHNRPATSGPELLVIGGGPGDATFLDIGHLFQTQLDEVKDSYAVLMDDIPEFVLPTLAAATAAQGIQGTRGARSQGATAANWWRRPGRRPARRGPRCRECTDHIIPLGERHLLRMLREYASYYNETRPRQSLKGNSPVPRHPETKPVLDVLAQPALGGLHHRYVRAA